MERIGREVERELARGGAGGALPLVALSRAWPTVVGDTVARNAWPLRLARDGTLHVATSSATWAFELDRLGDEIQVRLQARLGDSAPPKLRFAVGPIPESQSRERPGRAPEKSSRSSPEVAREAAAAAAVIDDPELRRLLARAARASLSRTASDRRF